VEAAGVTYTKGNGFYQVGIKREKISATKKLVVLGQNGSVEDQPSESRALLGLEAGAVELSDAGCGGHDVFVQSTSGNRQLKAGSRMLFEVAFVEPAGSSGRAAAPKRESAQGATTRQAPGPKRGKSSASRELQEDPDRASRPPLVLAWMDRVDAAILTAFPALQQDQQTKAFIKQVGIFQIDEMFEKHAAGECQCIEAAVDGLAAAEWFGSDFYYEDNWSFSKGILKDYDGCESFNERFPIDDFDVEQGTYDCEELFTILRQCVCDTIQAACCCEADNQPARAAAAAPPPALPEPETVPQVAGVARAITTDPVSSVEFCSVTGRLFCLSYDGSTHSRSLVAFDAASANEVGRLSTDAIASGCHGGGGPICVGGRLLMFGEKERFIQIYDCATLQELYAGPNPLLGSQYAHEDTIRGARVINGELFTSTYHYSRRWSLCNVIATPAGPPELIIEYKGTGNTAGSTHDFQVTDDGGRALFAACDEQSIRAYDLHKSRCIKKGTQSLQLLLPTDRAGYHRI
jgi:hypothetical protein